MSGHATVPASHGWPVVPPFGFCSTTRTALSSQRHPLHGRCAAYCGKRLAPRITNHVCPLGGDLTTTALRLGPAWLALGFTAAEHDPDRFQGFHAASTLVIVDEACGVSEEIDNAVDSILSGEHARLLRIGNPTNPATPFGAAFRGMRGKQFAISAFDTPNFCGHGHHP
jgi:hypothetical protein